MENIEALNVEGMKSVRGIDKYKRQSFGVMRPKYVQFGEQTVASDEAGQSRKAWCEATGASASMASKAATIYRASLLDGGLTGYQPEDGRPSITGLYNWARRQLNDEPEPTKVDPARVANDAVKRARKAMTDAEFSVYRKAMLVALG